MAVKIDWDLVDELLEAGCDGTEIAAYIGIHFNTLSLKCKKEKKSEFCDYKAQKRSKGNSLLKKRQFDSAIDGSIPMQIWLGKNRLGQTDKKEVVSENKNTNTFDLSNLTDEQLEQFAKLSAIIQPDTSGEGQT